MIQKNKPKVIVGIKGGLGNQLFCYAAGRRLSIVNDAELVIDNTSGFERDFDYKRKYELGLFNIHGRISTSNEIMEPFGRIRRKVARIINKKISYEKRWYIEQEGLDFDSRLINLKVVGQIILDGYWQSEGYFKDISTIIRKDLTFTQSFEASANMEMQPPENSNYVAIHMRWFDMPGLEGGLNLSLQYYINAIRYFDSKLNMPRYYIFSDNSEAARTMFSFISDRINFISDKNSSVHEDLYFMSRFKYYILSNSTLNWWAAWLSSNLQYVVIPSADTFPILFEQHACLYDAFANKSIFINSK
jgi:hypothetical protein